MRRLIALCLLLLTTSSNLEAVVGLLRDGRVHHEDLATATQHANADGEHGHEDASAPAGHRHGRSHEHGTSSDHCTHHHGMALIPSFAFLILTADGHIEYDETAVRHTSIFKRLTHPPRA
jgi:hypothetical protein